MKDGNAKRKLYKDALTINHLTELWRRKVLALLGKPEKSQGNKDP